MLGSDFPDVQDACRLCLVHPPANFITCHRCLTVMGRLSYEQREELVSRLVQFGWNAAARDAHISALDTKLRGGVSGA